MGEERIQVAVSKLRAFPSVDKVLWFGFGVKHLIHSLTETKQGVACIAIFASLAETYPVGISGKIVRELSLLEGVPPGLTPALRQWVAMVQSCAGVLAPTEFSLILNQLTLLYFRSRSPQLHESSTPSAIAQVLHGLIEVSVGNIESIQVHGGPDCAYVVALAYWILGLSVETRGKNGEILYEQIGPNKKQGSRRDQRSW